MAKKVIARKTSRGAAGKLKVIGRNKSQRLVGNAVEYVGRLAAHEVKGTPDELLESVELAEQALALGKQRDALSHAFEASERLVEMARKRGTHSEEMRQVAERAKSVIMRVLEEC
jgi:lysyl-tRNA synthetase class I